EAPEIVVGCGGAPEGGATLAVSAALAVATLPGGALASVRLVAVAMSTRTGTANVPSTASARQFARSGLLGVEADRRTRLAVMWSRWNGAETSMPAPSLRKSMGHTSATVLSLMLVA